MIERIDAAFAKGAPDIDLLGLGASRLSQNLNQLARAVNTGSLPVTPETEADLKEACDAVVQLRNELMRALGSTPPGGSS